MVLWIGVDDTDSLQGMCTTFLATELVGDLTRDHDLIGYPRLVRLNPNIPWKTRGNGAVCLRVGRGRGEPRIVGRIDGREVRAHPRGDSQGEPDGILERVAALVERWSAMEDETTNPGFVVLRRPAPPHVYWRAVRTILSKAEATKSVRGLGVCRGYKEARGLIGAIAATAWRPRNPTYEILTFRDRSRWGGPRTLDSGSVMEMDRAFPSTFNSYDFQNRRVVIAPHSPCPVLFGIRGDDPDSLQPAMSRIRGETPERWLLFETNQGTDDHVVATGLLEPLTSVRFRGTVSAPPRVLPGGHVVFSVRGNEVTAYEPSKQFRSVVRQLMVGDRVEVVGAVREAPRTINLEKLRIKSLTTATRKVANPWCPVCGKRAKSRGRGAGFRCSRCGGRFRPGEAAWREVRRSLSPGWYEPPVGSRRHLSRPLKREGDRRVA